MPTVANAGRLMESLHRAGNQADWYAALVSVALDENGHDLDKAIDAADEALRANPRAPEEESSGGDEPVEEYDDADAPLDAAPSSFLPPNPQPLNKRPEVVPQPAPSGHAADKPPASQMLSQDVAPPSSMPSGSQAAPEGPVEGEPAMTAVAPEAAAPPAAGQPPAEQQGFPPTNADVVVHEIQQSLASGKATHDVIRAHLGALTDDELQGYAQQEGLGHVDRREALAQLADRILAAHHGGGAEEEEEPDMLAELLAEEPEEEPEEPSEEPEIRAQKVGDARNMRLPRGPVPKREPVEEPEALHPIESGIRQRNIKDTDYQRWLHRESEKGKADRTPYMPREYRHNQRPQDDEAAQVAAHRKRNAQPDPDLGRIVEGE